MTQLHIKVMNKPKEWRMGQAYFKIKYLKKSIIPLVL